VLDVGDLPCGDPASQDAEDGPDHLFGVDPFVIPEGLFDMGEKLLFASFLDRLARQCPAFLCCPGLGGDPEWQSCPCSTSLLPPRLGWRALAPLLEPPAQVLRLKV
jgi:hypothetical protein